MPSSVIASFDYSEETSVLRVVFVSGSIYEYLDISPDVYLAMKASGAKGIFLNRQIKGKYDFRKVR